VVTRVSSRVPGAGGLGASGSGAKGGREAGLVAMRPHPLPTPPAALAREDCLWYLDRNGSWHPGFNCEFFTFCCGTCYQRYCCRDLTLLITERQQKHCLAFRVGAEPLKEPQISACCGPLLARSWSTVLWPP